MLHVTRESVTEYRSHGAVAVRNLVPLALITHLGRVMDDEVTEGRGRGFAREKKDIAANDSRLHEFCRSIADPLEEVLGYRPIITQCLGFEIVPGSAGFPWHVGVGSFNFVRPECRGCSIWIPLSPIDPRGQGGGIRYVTKQTVSGLDVFRSSLGRKRFLRRARDAMRRRLLDRFKPALNLDEHGIEPAFEVGDGLLFDKFVMHRSAPFRPGERSSRRAFVIRFLESDARFARAQYLEVMQEKGGTYAAVNTFAQHLLDLREGERLRNSHRCVSL